MHFYLLLDGARLEHRLGLGQELNDHHRSLYRGVLEPDIEAAGPYLFTFPHNDAFKSWYTNDSSGDHWGILVMAPVSFEELYKHFRRFLTVNTEDGQKLYFRYYDPRVLRVFLPTCDSAQLSEFFGSIKYFFAEDEDPEFILRFSLQNRTLLTDRLPAGEFMEHHARLGQHKTASNKEKDTNDTGPSTEETTSEHNPRPSSRRKPPGDVRQWLH